MSAHRCWYCPQPAAHGHHPTATLAGKYLDPELKVPLCLDHHRSEHAIWQTQGIEDRAAPMNLIEKVELWLRRLGITFERFHQNAVLGLEAFWGALGTACATRADELRDAMQRLDARDPHWRIDPGLSAA